MFLIILLVLILIFIITFFIPAYTSPIKDSNGKIVEGSIASLEKVKLGKTEQSVLIRGENTDNPVLLFLHGGPGTSETGLLRKYNLPLLEKHFTVVLWDQRGAAKSFAAIKPESDMNIEQFISDTHELTVLLCHRFNQKKICLAGHSWGSALGVLTIHKYPELFSVYVGIGQVVNMLEGEKISYNWTLEQAIKAGDKKSVSKLKSMGEPPYSGDWRSKTVAQRKMLGKFGGEVYGNSTGGFFITIVSLFQSEYSWKERINFFRAIFTSMSLMWPQIMNINLIEQAPELKVPVYFLEGTHDYEAPSELAETYYKVLKAPSKKLIWFRNSAHFINAEESDKFNQFFVQLKHELTNSKQLEDSNINS